MDTEKTAIGAGESSPAHGGSPDRVPEADRNMIFHVCRKLAVVLGLNAQEQAWLESLGATFLKPNNKVSGPEPAAKGTPGVTRRPKPQRV